MWRLSSISSILHNETKRCSIKDGTRRLVTFFIENRSGNVRINFIQYHNVVFSRELIFTVSFISTLFKLAASSWFNTPDEEVSIWSRTGSWILSVTRFLLCYHFSTCCTVESDHAIQRWQSPISISRIRTNLSSEIDEESSYIRIYASRLHQ